MAAGGRIIGRRDLTDKVWLVPRVYPDLSKILGNCGTLRRFFCGRCPGLDLQDIDYASPVVFIELDEEMPGVTTIIERALNNE